MFGKIKLTSLAAVAGLLLAAASASALTSSGACPAPYTTTGAYYGPYGTGSKVIVVAVAANFTQPLDAYLTTYFVPSYGSADKVYFCADSTTNLEATIGTGSSSPYAMLFAADNSPQSKYPSDSPYLYAYGLPVFFGYLAGNATNTVTGLSELLTTGTGCTITNNQISATPSALAACTISPTLTAKAKSVTIANPLKAPYGNDAANILDLTKPIVPQTSYSVPVLNAISPAVSKPTEVDPAWLVPSPTNANITKSFQAVGTGTVYAGFAAVSQVCKIKSQVAWVQFSDSHFVLNQYIAVYSANDLNTQIKAQMRTSIWNSFIKSWCYLPI